MHRRTFLKNAALLAGAASWVQSAPGLGSSARALNRFKLGAISDGFSQDFEKALQIMKGYGLSWVEIRDVWGKYNTEATPEEIGRVKRLLGQYSFKCSVVDSALFKCVLPGTTPISHEGGSYPYSGQMDLLKRAIDRAHAWGTDKVRGFTFWRVAKPEKIYPRISEELAKASAVAKIGGIRLVIENEGACNGGTGHEIAAILKMTPSPNLGYNWDVGNGYEHGEVSYPDGYNALDKSRIWHMHLKGIQCSPGFKHCHETFADEGEINLVGQFRALLRDHYNETMSLECEFRAPGMTHQQTTERSMQGLLRVVNKAVA
ncbi:MAG: sugar phosphate isomerase/epimerase family protein [Terriglobia bacterium]